MGKDNDSQIIRPPDTLSAKISTGGPGAVDLEALERAETVITDMTDSYLDWVVEDLGRLDAALAELEAASGGYEKLLNNIFEISHDMKGQGGSFGYQLMTILGDGLCRFIDKVQDCGPKEIEAIKLYVSSMNLVIANRMRGDGGGEGEKLLKGLELVAAKVSKD